MPGRVDGKVVLVTGGGNGMGRAECKLLAQEGAKVVIGDIRDADGQRTEAEITEAGGQALFIHLDVTNEESWQNAVDQAVARFGKLDVLVNDAAISSSSQYNVSDVEGWDNIMEVNAKGTFLGIRYVVPKMIQVGGGSIVNISSISGLVGGGGEKGHPAYNASKGAHPGAMPPMTSADPGAREGSTARTAAYPIPRWGRVEEVAYGVNYLDSGVSGGPEGAAEGALTLFIGGDEAVYNRVKPVLNAIGPNHFHMGPIGAGHEAKSLNNLLGAVNMAAAYEVLQVAEKAGLDLEKLVEAISISSGRSRATEERIPNFWASGQHDRDLRYEMISRFVTKDVGIACSVGKTYGAPMFIANLVHQIVMRVSDETGGGRRPLKL